MKRFIKVAMIVTVLLSSFSMYPTNVEAGKFNMSYLYFGSTSSYINYISKTNGSLDVVTPSYFDLYADGTLDAKVDPAFVTEMHRQNIKVVPFLSNHWDREKGRIALDRREELVKEIVAVINQYNLDGINIDIENVTELERDKYTDFVRLLREALPADKEVSVAVAAKTYDAKVGWHASYDFANLAKYSDYLMLMTYDESYYGSKPGPVASDDFVEKAIQYALKYVPADKIVLGIPFYGRYWNIDSTETGGRGIPLRNVESLMNQFGGKSYFDEDKKSPYTTFYVPEGSDAKVHGRPLTPGRYVIWYENDTSIKLKLKLVEKYNIKGTGSWSLSEAPERTWNYYSSWLNGKHYFIDAENHWAENDINSVLDMGWMLGTSDYTFAPNKQLTRAEATVVLVRALGLKNNNTEVKDFNDISDHFWAKNEIEIAYQHGVINGITNDTFAPNEIVTRDQMAAMLSRIITKPQNVNYANPFPDLSKGHWAYKDILLLNSLNIYNGYDDGKFHPKDKVTRAQMAALMNRISYDIIK